MFSGWSSIDSEVISEGCLLVIGNTVVCLVGAWQ